MYKGTGGSGFTGSSSTLVVRCPDICGSRGLSPPVAEVPDPSLGSPTRAPPHFVLAKVLVSEAIRAGGGSPAAQILIDVASRHLECGTDLPIHIRSQS